MCLPWIWVRRTAAGTLRSHYRGSDVWPGARPIRPWSPRPRLLTRTNPVQPSITAATTTGIPSAPARVSSSAKAAAKSGARWVIDNTHPAPTITIMAIWEGASIPATTATRAPTRAPADRDGVSRPPAAPERNATVVARILPTSRITKLAGATGWASTRLTMTWPFPTT